MNDLQVSNDPFCISLPSPIQISTIFESLESYATSLYPWTIEPSPNTSCRSPLASQFVPPTFGPVDGFSYRLTSPPQTPDSSFFFEIEPDKTIYEQCYDEFMEVKLAVLREIPNGGKACSFSGLQ